MQVTEEALTQEQKIEVVGDCCVEKYSQGSNGIIFQLFICIPDNTQKA